MENNKYQDVMSRLNVTPEMAERVLEGIRDGEDLSPSMEKADRKERGIKIVKDTAKPGEKTVRYRKFTFRRYTYMAAACALFLVGAFLGLAVGSTGNGYRSSSPMKSYSEVGDVESSGADQSFDTGDPSAVSDYDGEEGTSRNGDSGYAAEESAEPMNQADGQNGTVTSVQGTSKDGSAASKDNKTEKNAADGQKLIYTADLQIETLDYAKSLRDLKEAIGNAGGYIEAENENAHVNAYDGYIEDGYIEDGYGEGQSESREKGVDRLMDNSLVIRIPTSAYASFLDGMTGIGSVVSRSQAVDNVTAYYHDTEVQIKALKIQEERLLEMMKKAESIEDMIMVEKRLTEVQAQLDSYESTLKGLDDQVDYARVNISLREVEKYRERPEAGFGQKAKSRLQEGFESFAEGMEDLFLWILYHIPAIILLIIVIVIARIFMRKRGWKPGFRKKDQEEIDPDLFED